MHKFNRKQGVADPRIQTMGWWSAPISHIKGGELDSFSRRYGYYKGLYNQIEMLKNRFSYSKYLITPPEIGPYGNQGAYAGFAPCYEITERTYYISREVSDEKLAKILEIFEAVSYDPEFYLISKYGFWQLPTRFNPPPPHTTNAPNQNNDSNNLMNQENIVISFLVYRADTYINLKPTHVPL
jgi:hypothetical protein